MHGELAVGTTITYAFRGRSTAVAITGYEPRRYLEISGSEKSYVMRESIALEADDASTTVSMTMSFEPTAAWARLVAPLFAPFAGIVLGRSLGRSLGALRREAEGA